MKAERDYGELVRRALNGLHGSEPVAAQVQQRAEQDVSAGDIIAVKICSHLLDACIWLAFDEDFKPDADEPLAVFYADEIPLLRDKTAGELRAIHRSKLVFPGARVRQ